MVRSNDAPQRITDWVCDIDQRTLLTSKAKRAFALLGIDDDIIDYDKLLKLVTDNVTTGIKQLFQSRDSVSWFTLLPSGIRILAMEGDFEFYIPWSRFDAAINPTQTLEDAHIDIIKGVSRALKASGQR